MSFGIKMSGIDYQSERKKNPITVNDCHYYCY